MSRLADPKQARAFRFLETAYEPATGDATLIYAFDDGPPLAETLNFPYTPWPVDPSRQQAFERALHLLHWIAGVSYWKAGVPARMSSEAAPLDRSAADFLRTLYTDGMAEFAHVNGLDLRDRLDLEVTAPAPPAPVTLDLPERALVAVGGGKDSLVALERLRDAGVEVQPFCVGASPLIEDTVRAAGLPLLRIGRRLSPLLAELNTAGAYNGHVPVTAINSAIGLCAALLYGYRWVVFANERSAEAATRRTDEGREINHQYSKTLAFERALRGQVAARISSGLQYFSLLR
ncbi:MAG: endonuclease domain-containing protein, partial [Xanthomonadales bacterium]|nr:endonuclease domain-containing protein [Xanthomonadales bacterium]